MIINVLNQSPIYEVTFHCEYTCVDRCKFWTGLSPPALPQTPYHMITLARGTSNATITSKSSKHVYDFLRSEQTLLEALYITQEVW